MAHQQHRFSRRFLTILIFITCVAIVLLSKLDETEEPLPINQPQQPEPATSMQPQPSQP